MVVAQFKFPYCHMKAKYQFINTKQKDIECLLGTVAMLVKKWHNQKDIEL